MGCSSSSLNKAGDSSRFGSGVPSNENSSTVEQNKFCVAQPKPCTPGEATFRGNTQRESRPPLERPKASVVPTANGVKSYCQQSLANDETPAKEATDHSRPLKKIEPLVQGGECELPQPGGKDDMLGTEDVKKDVEARTEIQSLKGNAEMEPLRISAERDSPGAGDDTKLPQSGTTTFLQTAENILPLETAQELLLAEEAMRKDAQPQILEAIPKENSSPEILEGYQLVEKVEQKDLQEIPRKDVEFQLLETIPKENSSPEIVEGSQSAENSEKQQLSEAPGEAEQPQVLETVLKENETPQMPDRSQLVPTPVMNKSLGEAPDGSRNAHESQPQVRGGNGVQPAETSETAAKVGMARESHPDKEEQHIEGETGEKVEAEMKNEKESEEAETKEKETGEAVDLGAAGASDRRA
ncbi:glutamate-rich protein 5 [Arvicanthis niloticus]|uniref:glutamate-rich protein 5 n=1 Tax=Arvicanthis niloticus TaxID=61156 RepID=UPI001486D556|nr:glutamate-rich protein 5 [Arvicanthis niloticus]